MSAQIRDEIKREITPVRARIWFGQFFEAPASLADLATIIVPDYDTTIHWSNCRWQARGSTLPAKGDECIVVFDNRNQPWVVAWWPV
jgi:hypothetical protein